MRRSVDEMVDASLEAEWPTDLLPAVDRWHELDIEAARRRPCLLWGGAVTTREGYAVFGGKRVARIVWVELNGPVRRGYRLMLVCQRGACVEVDHLRALPIGEIARRNRSPAGLNLRKAVCSTCGGPFDVLKADDAGRNCRRCNRRAASALRSSKRRAAAEAEGREFGKPAKKTTCPYGHPLEAPNLTAGGRCRECSRVASKAHYWRYAARERAQRTARYRANPEAGRAASKASRQRRLERRSASAP